MSRSKPRVVDVVQALLQNGTARGPKIMLLTPDQATLQETTGRLLRVLTLPEERAELEELLNQSLRNNQKAGTDVILVGGSSVDRTRIEQAFPAMQLYPFRVAHVAANGMVSVFPTRQGGHLAARLGDVALLTPEQERELIQRAQVDERARHEDQRLRADFLQRMSDRPAHLTPAILGVIFVIFAAQMAWFDGDLAVGLGFGGRSPQDSERWLLHTLKMGALYSPLVDQGQWWRMLTAGFMHHGLMHVAVNCFALYILGRQLEKVLGGARFLVVYAAALVGGSVASYFLTDGVSAGASGAIWGLLGAQVALAYGRPAVLPRSLADAIRPLAMQNVFLNMLISLVPGIDWAAHFGGGVAGGLVLATGLLHDQSEPERLPLRVWLLAATALLILVGGALLCLLAGYLTRAGAQVDLLGSLGR